jgi:hypothetical protein
MASADLDSTLPLVHPRFCSLITNNDSIPDIPRNPSRIPAIAIYTTAGMQHGRSDNQRAAAAHVLLTMDSKSPYHP